MALSIHTLTFNFVEENTYILIDEESKNAAIIDCGCMNAYEENKLIELLNREKAIPILLLFTHLHFDHTWGCSFASKHYGLTPKAHQIEIESMPPFQDQLKTFGFGAMPSTPQPDYVPLHTGDEILLGESKIKVLFVPGHTPGHVAYYLPTEKKVFVGDVLFDQGGIGRTDLMGGDFQTLINSIKRELTILPDDTEVYSGHGRSFTIQSVHKHNSYIR